MTAVAADVSRETPDRAAEDRAAVLELVKRQAEEIRALKAELADSFVSVKLRWSLVRSGDVIVSKTGALLPVMEVDSPETGGMGAHPGEESEWSFRIVEDGVNRWLKSTDPDRPVPVLVREREAFALKLLRGELNITVMDRKSGSS